MFADRVAIITEKREIVDHRPSESRIGHPINVSSSLDYFVSTPRARGDGVAFPGAPGMCLLAPHGVLAEDEKQIITLRLLKRTDVAT